LRTSSVDLLELFVGESGELIYFLILIGLSLASLFMVLGLRTQRVKKSHAIQAYTIALSGVVFAWMLLLVGALYVTLADREFVEVLPPLERFVSLVTLLFLSWGFLTADHGRWGRVLPDGLLLVLVAIVSGGYVVTAVRWLDLAGSTDFNLSDFGATWTFAPALLSLFCALVVIAYVRYIQDAPLKLVFYLILLGGYAGTLFQISEGNIIGDYSGATCVCRCYVDYADRRVPRGSKRTTGRACRTVPPACQSGIAHTAN
jgi:hypothetical protein